MPSPLLRARGVEVHFDGVQVLFGVDFNVEDGEIVALLGTNGAGKSTLLKAMSGLAAPSAGAVSFDGEDITRTPADEVATRGIVLVPGGQGVFSGLTVAENLRLAGWLQRHRHTEVARATQRVLAAFPALRTHLHQPAGNLSGGQQRMLTMGMAFLRNPRLLMIDELSLGLAPVVVAELLEMIRMLNEHGTTIVVVEQSLNLALTVAGRAYVMEKGEIRYQSKMLDPSMLRSVFLATAQRDPPVQAAPAAVLDAWDRPLTYAPPILRVRNVTKHFGGLRALDDVSFDVAPNEILGFIGPNGAGKTSLFDVIAGTIAADHGRVRLRTQQGITRDLGRFPDHERAWYGLARSFQDSRLFGGLTVAESIAVACEQHIDVREPIAACLHLPFAHASERQLAAEVDDLIELLGLSAYRDKFVRELSTGTRRIVDLACVLAQRPTVVLLDEPSSGIAQREAEALAPLLHEVHHNLAASLLVIEHDLPLLSSVADRIIALDLGRIIAEGEPHHVLNHPAVIASYTGTDPRAINRSGPAVRPPWPRLGA